MVLEGNVEIRLGQVPGIIGLGKEAKVRQLQTLHQLFFLFEPGFGHPLLIRRMSQGPQQKKDQDRQVRQEQVPFSHGHHSSPFRTSAVTPLNLNKAWPLWSFMNPWASASFLKGISSRPMGP